MKKSFTVEEFLQAAEQNKFTNTNDAYVAYEDDFSSWHETPRFKGQQPIRACVIGEAFINLGMVPNGITPYDLSWALQNVKPDAEKIAIDEFTFNNLADFINILNGVKGYRGKKNIPKLVRKYFSKSLNQEVTLDTKEKARWS